MVLTFDTIFVAAVLIMLGLLLGATLRNILQNCTNIEQLERSSEERSAHFDDRPENPYPYSIGYRKSLELALGPRAWAWPFPLPSSWQLRGLGAGDEWETVPGALDIDWPPKDSYSPSDYYSDSDYQESESMNNDRDLITTDHTQGDGWRSEPDLRNRMRRDSEGYMLPARLPWHLQHSMKSETFLNR